MKNRRKWAMVLAITLAAMLLFSFVVSALYSALSATTLDNLKSRQKEITAEKARNAEKRAAMKTEQKSLVNQKLALDEHISLVEQEIENTAELIQEYTLQIAETQTKYAEAVASEREMQERYMLRIRAMEEAGDISYISILMNSRTFSDLLGRISTISEIAESDRKVIEELQAAREEIAEYKVQLETEKLEQLESKQSLADAQAELVEQYRELDQLIADIESNLDELTIADKKADADMEATQKEIQKILDEEARKSAAKSKYVGGTFLWPVPDYTYISSKFGPRMHPTLKVMKTHTGVDLAAPTGTAIYAANSGKVITSGYNSGYGNYIAIDHGGGVVTLYAHASKLLVKKGAEVKKGDKIALVGSTGVSTGPHCHFEVIENGTRKNPMDYFERA